MKLASGIITTGLAAASLMGAAEARAITYDSSLAYSGPNKTGLSTSQRLTVIKEYELTTERPNTQGIQDQQRAESFGNSLWGGGYQAGHQAYAIRMSDGKNRLYTKSGASAWGRIFAQKATLFSFNATASAISDGTRQATYQIYAFGQQVANKSASGGSVPLASANKSWQLGPTLDYQFMIGPVPVEVEGELHLTAGLSAYGKIDPMKIGATFEPYSRLYGMVRVTLGAKDVFGASGEATITLLRAGLPFNASVAWTSLPVFKPGYICKRDMVTAEISSQVSLSALDGTFDITAYLLGLKYTERVAEWKAPFQWGYYLFENSAEATTTTPICTKMPLL